MTACDVPGQALQLCGHPFRRCLGQSNCASSRHSLYSHSSTGVSQAGYQPPPGCLGSPSSEDRPWLDCYRRDLGRSGLNRRAGAK